MPKLTIQDAPLLVDLGVLDVAVLDGRVVVGDEELLEELYGEGALADTAVPDDDQLEGHEVVVVGWSRHRASGSDAAAAAAVLPTSAYPDAGSTGSALSSSV